MVKKTTPFVDDYLLYLLAAVSNNLSQEFHNEVRKSGLKISKWRVLASLSDRPGLMLTDLAKLVLFEQSHLTKVIDQLAAEGLVEKQRSSEDRRRLALKITADGQALINPLIRKAQQHEGKMFDILTRGELADLKIILKRLIAAHR